MRSLILLAILSCLVSLGSLTETTGESTPRPARLLIEKKIMNKYLVEGKDIIVNYHIYNVGDVAAKDIVVSDASLDSQYFAVQSGVSSFSIPKLDPGSNVSHTVVYRPKENVWGSFNFTSAEVSYTSGETATRITGLTSEPGQGFIVTQKEFERKFSSHALDWIAFVVMTLPCLLLPYLLWNRSSTRYGTHVNKIK